jgi:V8-like Glu-specific endopeptidase
MSSLSSSRYPGDKPYGTMWKTSGTLNTFNGCDGGIQDGNNGLVRSTLDIAGGQSGSHVWDKGYYTRALVNAVGTESGQAIHRTVTKSVVNWLSSHTKVMCSLGLASQPPVARGLAMPGMPMNMHMGALGALPAD